MSGLAAAIDAAAHEAALSAGGRAVAVIRTGVKWCYPSANRILQRQILDEGLVLSQFWPDAPPRRQHFPMRNAVMSGYAAATLVVTARPRREERRAKRGAPPRSVIDRRVYFSARCQLTTGRGHSPTGQA